ncbi:MAG: response regulator [Acholeplasmataceae bacterium]|nr:response regulator [Acholeplasmataceae bacterium]
MILEKSNNYQIVGIFKNGADALEGVITLKPDILVTDVKISYINGMDLIEQVKLEVPYLKSIY